jgi:mono/diheme cytochrome c family protein
LGAAMGFLGGFLAALVTLALVLTALIYGGVYNVAATEPHTAWAEWILDTGMRRSAASRAAAVSMPDRFSDEDVRGGVQVFDAKCAPCHGGPGRERGEIAKGMRPQPPDLGEASRRWSNAELFWIAKHGIRMTGMPAFGPTHDDRQLWTVVAFVRRLPELTPEEYKRIGEGPATRPREERRR